MSDKPTITCTGRCNGMGDPDDTGSYVRIIFRMPAYGRGHGYEHHLKFSEGEVETLIAELQGAINQKSEWRWQFQVDGRAGPSQLRDSWNEAARDCVAAGYGRFISDGRLSTEDGAAIVRVKVP